MTARREQITELLTAELGERGFLDDDDVIVGWTCLIGLHGATVDGDLPSTAAIRSGGVNSIHAELGLIEQRKMRLQAIITEASRRHIDDDD